MKHCLLASCLCLLLAWPAQAQTPLPSPTPAATATPQPTNFTLNVESAYLRALPSANAEARASVFEGANLRAVGRNADGLWLQVARPGQDQPIGWLRRDLALFSFDLTRLPLTDSITGVTGPTPIVDTGYAVQILSEVNLRPNINFDGDQVLATVPFGLVLPALERDLSSAWVKVNYLGTVGWVAEFLVRPSVPLKELPVTEERFGDSSVVLEVIPPEVQRAQALRFIAYAEAQALIADQVATFWAQLQEGLTVVCQPPATVPTFRQTARDLVELPELRRVTRRLPQVISDLNASIDLMRRCGRYSFQEITRASAQAINARVILQSSLDDMRRIEKTIIPR